MKRILDGLNYLAGQTVQYVNQKAYEARTLIAHMDGGTPNIISKSTAQMPGISAIWSTFSRRPMHFVTCPA